MTFYITWAFITIGFAQFLIYLKKGNRFTDFFIFLFFTLGLCSMLEGFENTDKGIQFISFCILYLAFHFILHQLISSKWANVFPFLSVFVFFVFWGNELRFQNYPLIFNLQNILLIPLTSVILFGVLKIKSRYLHSFLPTLNIEGFLFSVGYALLLFIALFLGNTFGLVLSGLVIYTVEIYFNRQQQQKKYDSILLFSFAFLIFILKKSNIDAPSLIQPSSLLGVMTGIGIGMLLSKTYALSRENVFQKVFVLFITLVFVIIIIYAELLKEHIGGLPAFSGLIIGFLLVTNTKNSSLNISFLGLSFGIILFSLPYVVPQKTEIIVNKKFEKIKQKIDPSVVSKPQEGSKNPIQQKANAEQAVGDWKINAKASKIDFELGPEDARTKGIFKRVEGTFIIGENTSNSLVKITLPLSGFSTYNSFRDDGLMGVEFFDAEKFPQLLFTSNKISLSEPENIFTIPGTFMMKGVRQPFTMKVKILDIGKDEKGDYMLLSGKASLDRTKFNMDSDPKIGDVVDFSCELELRK